VTTDGIYEQECSKAEKKENNLALILASRMITNFVQETSVFI